VGDSKQASTITVGSKASRKHINKQRRRMPKPKLVWETPVYKVMLIREETLSVTKEVITTPADAARVVSDYLRGADREHFVSLYFNSARSLIGIHTVSVGTLNASLVHAREVFKVACIIGAASIIVSHNHPSGSVEPSREDIEITRQLVKAGKILGIPVDDHVIVTGDGSYISFVDRGLIREMR
jgi:DNA repair protein RadC